MNNIRAYKHSQIVLFYKVLWDLRKKLDLHAVLSRKEILSETGSEG